ncbi:(2Fe-2S)-binding protein [Marinifilum sp. RC60d5]|uniref:(2Fe-2S)-binding protein n=1 Tax=Marinifilum sp. RC60d5 TaxID=3458414 RepID=UPI0040369987
MRDIVCNCQMVDRNTINKAIHEKNATSIEEIRRYTGANTGCGKCMPYINSILDSEVPKVVQKEKSQRKFKLW